MGKFMEGWLVFFNNLTGALSTIFFTDIIDILIVAYIFYQLMRLVRETRAMQLLKGIGAILALFLFAQILDMTMLQFFIRNILTWGIIAIVVLFQPELRRALEQMGRSKLSIWGRYGSDDYEAAVRQYRTFIDATCSVASYLSETKTGALIVVEREIKLGEIVKTGTLIDAEPSFEMIANLFFPNSPLHDGAVVVRKARLYAAGCFLPLSANMDIGRELGTRHRAALGMSEVSDAVVIVVSEETGAITVACNSRLQRGLSPEELERLLEEKLIGSPPEDTGSSKLKFWRRKKA